MTVLVTIFDSKKEKRLTLSKKKSTRRKVSFSLCGPDAVRTLRQDLLFF